MSWHKAAIVVVAGALALGCASCSRGQPDGGGDAGGPPPPSTCDPGFADPPNCSTFVAQPTISSYGLRESGTSFWDGSGVLGDDGRYHLFASRFANACGLSTWSPNSECVRAVSGSPLGPFQVEELLVPAFCHNPTVRRAADGTFLLFYIGAPTPAAQLVTTCTAGHTVSDTSSGLVTSVCSINVISSPSVLGPWSAPVQLTDDGWIPLCPTNPAPVLADDGSVELYFRGYQLGDDGGTVERLFVASATTYGGPYAPVSYEPLFTRPAEDPFVWKRADGRGYRLLFDDKFTDPVNVGGQAASPDETSFAPAGSAYGLEVPLTDGTVQTVVRRERPQILWLNDEQGVLYNGVQPSSADDSSYVLAVPIGEGWN
jgi:hypothetical protein